MPILEPKPKPERKPESRPVPDRIPVKLSTTPRVLAASAPRRIFAPKPDYAAVGSRGTRPRRRTHRVKLRTISGRGEMGFTAPPAVLEHSGLAQGELMSVTTDGNGMIVYRSTRLDHITEHEPLEIIILSKSERADIAGWLARVAEELQYTIETTTDAKQASKVRVRRDKCLELAQRIGGNRL